MKKGSREFLQSFGGGGTPELEISQDVRKSSNLNFVRYYVTKALISIVKIFPLPGEGCYARRSAGQSTQILFTLAKGATHVVLPTSQRKSVFTLAKGATHVDPPISQRKYVFTLVKGAAHAALSNKQRKCAFTLPEVLITLGIIGVVAAITMPVIISKIQDRQNITKWKKAYSTVSNAFNLIISENITVCRQGTYSNGKCSMPLDSSNKYGGDTFQYSEEFIERFRAILQPVSACYRYIDPKCDNDGFSSHIKFYWAGISIGSTVYGTLKLPYNERNQTPVAVYSLANVAFLLKDGSVVYLGGTHGGPWISVDVNGAAQGPNQIGRDFFIISVFNNKILPLGAEGTYNKDANNGKCECSKDAGTETMTYFAGAGGVGEVVSGGCCSAEYLLK